jgi:hypothetical protein
MIPRCFSASSIISFTTDVDVDVVVDVEEEGGFVEGMKRFDLKELINEPST